MTNSSQRDFWDKLDTGAKAFAAILIPLILAVVGFNFDAVLTEREVQGQIVAVAVETLRDPSTKDNTNLRRWAVSVINTYSGVPLSTDLQEELIQGLSFPDSPSIRETPTPPQ